MLLTTLLLWIAFIYVSSASPHERYARAQQYGPYAELPDYGAFQGIQITSSLSNIPLPYPVDAWLGIDYSIQPIGSARFNLPTWPEPFSGAADASNYGPACVQGSSSYQSEACLNFNVYRTEGIPLTEKLPVLVWIHGGAFVSGSGRSLDGAAFVAQSASPIVVITFQYRLGSLGSLPSKLMRDAGLLNLGLRDQRFFLEFLKEYVECFGGDPNAITLGGQSAGAHSVGIHYFHNYGSDAGSKPLFARAIIASGGVTARSFPPATYPLYEQQFQQYMSYLGCPTSGESALKCLRSADIKDIQYIQSALYGASERNITWPFQPVSGGPLLEKLGSVSGIDGTFFHLPLLTTSTTDEGKAFVPQDLETDSELSAFLKNIGPGLTAADIEDLKVLYPSPLKYPQTSPYRNSPKSTQFNRVAAAWGDYAYICPVQETASRVSARGVPVWKARFNTPDYNPSWAGIPHAADGRYYNGLPSAEFPDISFVYHAYWASFVATGDPNTVKVDYAPFWEKYGKWGGGEKGVELVVEKTGAKMEWEGNGIRNPECKWWRDEARMKRLNK